MLDLDKPAHAATDRRIRVMIVDDAIVVRGMITRWLKDERDFELVASLRTGREAVEQIDRADPDVVVLDVDMPELDGLAALPRLLARKPDLVVIMASTLTRRNADVSLRALSLGATDYLPKPASSRDAVDAGEFRRSLIEKIRVLGQRRQRTSPRAVVSSGPYDTKPTLAPRLVDTHYHAAHVGGFELRTAPIAMPRALLIGCSTGGPQALNVLMARLGPLIERAPVLITQHMPPTFTTILAEHLTRLVGRPVREAKDGETVLPGSVLLAPGGRHLRVARCDNAAVVVLDDSPPVNFCKPAVDPMLASAADVWGAKALALILTGMGADGVAGARAIVAAGGAVIAQDEATSVVWGMPGQVANAGLCSAVLPLPEIAPKLVRLFTGERP